MIFKFKKKTKVDKSLWRKKFIWWPMFFSYQDNTYFVFRENVELRQNFINSDLFCRYYFRPIQG